MWLPRLAADLIEQERSTIDLDVVAEFFRRGPTLQAADKDDRDRVVSYECSYTDDTALEDRETLLRLGVRWAFDLVRVPNPAYRGHVKHTLLSVPYSIAQKRDWGGERSGAMGSSTGGRYYWSEVE